MGWIRYFRRELYWRLWVRTVVPTSGIFLAAAFVLRAAVRAKFAGVMLADGRSGLVLFDQCFAGEYILMGFLLSLAVSTVATAMSVKYGLRPFRDMIRLTKELARGNFAVRMPQHAHTVSTYHDLAVSIDALADSLERTERLRRDLVANLAHEIRTPLTNLQGYLEALRDGVIEPNQEALVSVHEEVLRLVRLVDALHQLARADAMRQQPLVLTPTDLDTMVEQLTRVMQHMAEARGVKLYMDMGTRHALVPVHADSVAQVIRNLLRNAVQYTDDGGIIRIQTAITNEAYRFTCLNTGAGIAPEDLPLIFNRFYRTASGKQGSGSGVGIGLAIAKEVVEAHQGHIGAESKAGWTMVWFEIPLQQSGRA